MRASPQDLVHAHALATVAPVLDLCDFYVSAAVATIKPEFCFIDVEEVFGNQKYIVLRTNKTTEELGLNLLMLNWETKGGEPCTFVRRGSLPPCGVYCKGIVLQIYFLSPNIESVLDDDEYLVVDYLTETVLGVIKLPCKT